MAALPGRKKTGRNNEMTVLETAPVCNEGVFFGRAKVAFSCS